MRLICPSCAAEYEIDAAAFGRRGRMVRCANCAAEWFQPAPTPSVSEAAAAVEAMSAQRRAEPTVLAPDPAPPPPPPPPPTTLEPQRPDDVYYDADPPRPAEVAARAAAAVRVDPPYPPRRAEPEALAATLRADDEEPKAGGAFLAGFATMTLIGLILIAIYVKAPEIAALAPAAAEPLAAYTEAVDRARVAVAALAAGS